MISFTERLDLSPAKRLFPAAQYGAYGDIDDEVLDEESRKENIAQTLLQFSSLSDFDTMKNYIQEINEYINEITRLHTRATALLEAEYNSNVKAVELQQYYVAQPDLTRYTIEKELSRLEYCVRTSNPDGSVFFSTNKKEIAQMFMDHKQSLCSRCANQSLLADLMHVLIGSDRLVRPQYMTAAIATKCRFRIDLTNSIVGVHATLDVILPSVIGGGWKIAEISVELLFSCPSPPKQPSMRSKIVDIRPAVQTRDNDWELQMLGVARMLTDFHAKGP